MDLKEIQKTVKRRINLYVSLYKDKRTPLISKVFLWIAIGYFFLPFDLIPDFIPILGQLDDLIIVSGFIFLSLRFIPKKVYDENYRKVFGKRIK
ncbi:MAG: YkvA family protein [archaeon]